MDAEACYRAIASRDRRFAGLFVVAVTSTRIYCRPGCPAPLPRRVNSRFFACAAAAEGAGFRPCRRCRPDASPGSPAWDGTSASVGRALRLIDAGALDGAGVEDLAARVGLGGRHLSRLFRERVGATPALVARTRRVHFARRLIDDTALPMTEVALASGFASVRSFNHAVRQTFGRTPTELRRASSARERLAPGVALALRLPFRPPYEKASLLSFLAARAVPGVEAVEGSTYRRTFALPDGRPAWLSVDLSQEDRARLRLSAFPGSRLLWVTERVTRTFDLDADPRDVDARLSSDPLLSPLVARRPGLRVPGAFDPFEVAVRAVLGQQVSVAAARTLARRIAERHGSPAPWGDRGLSLVFPGAAALAGADLSGLGLTSRRAEAIRALSRAVAEGSLRLEAAPGLVERLASLPGLGRWTAEYVALRAVSDPDAFPSGDLVLRRAVSADRRPVPERELTRRAEAWRPFRAYAALHLWAAAAAEETSR